MSNRPDWCPEDVWTTAVFASGPAEPFYSPHATRIVVARAIMDERERWELIEIPCCAHEFYMLGYEAAKATRDPQV